ncbi:PREDICTED: protein PLANT CADMIUM RESISTANCE 10-like isoform 1 [Fragaria vesca subsp. vesca]
MGSCTTHFLLWVLVNTVCCLLTACGYRRALRSKYNLQYREIREKSAESGPGDLNLAIVTAPAVQTMEPGLDK